MLMWPTTWVISAGLQQLIPRVTARHKENETIPREIVHYCGFPGHPPNLLAHRHNPSAKTQQPMYHMHWNQALGRNFKSTLHGVLQ